jgi:hypothetical protein
MLEFVRLLAMLIYTLYLVYLYSTYRKNIHAGSKEGMYT